MSIIVKLPKHFFSSLEKKVTKALTTLDNGTAQLRKTERFGYRTLSLGLYERAVLIGNTLHVFNQHKTYERFINQGGR